MAKILYDVLLSIVIILSILLLVAGNIVRFVYWIKYRKESATYCYSDFWYNEWGTECSNEEIEKLHQMIRSFEEKHADSMECK